MRKCLQAPGITPAILKRIIAIDVAIMTIHANTVDDRLDCVLSYGNLHEKGGGAYQNITAQDMTDWGKSLCKSGCGRDAFLETKIL